MTVDSHLKTWLGRITKSVLKPQHKLEILKTNVIPRLLYEVGLEYRSAGFLNDLDIQVRRAVRRWLHLPKDVPIPMYHADIENGGLGIVNLKTRIPKLQIERIRRLDSIEGKDPYLNALTSSHYWQKLKQRTLEAINRLGLDDTLNEKEIWKNRLYNSIDGIGLVNHSNRSGYRSKWLSDSSFLKLSGKEFVGAVHVRVNSLLTRERSTRGRITDRGRNCPGCPDKRESLAHILQVCGRTKNHRCFRHNWIVKNDVNGLKKKDFIVKKEPRIPVKTSFMKPDIVAFNRKKGLALVLDPSIVAVSRNLTQAEMDKREKYDIKEVRKWMEKTYGKADLKVHGLILDWKGAWAPESWKILCQVGLKTGFLESLSFKVLKLSRWLYGCVQARTDV